MAKGPVNQHKNLAMTGKVKTPVKNMKSGGAVKTSGKSKQTKLPIMDKKGGKVC